MIISGTIKNERLILKAESDKEMNTIKGGLAGKNAYLAISPYGNRVNFSVNKNMLIVEKDSGRPFAYEEIRTILKKIMLFEKITKKIADIILAEARTTLDAKLTLFYPSAHNPAAEVTFSYNWASIAFEKDKTGDLLPEIRNSVESGFDSALKVFSNSTDVISLHDYAMRGIYVGRNTFDGLAEVLIGSGLISPEERSSFVVKATAFGVISIIYLEARRLCKATDETFDINDSSTYNPLVGAKEFLRPALKIMEILAENGTFSSLNPIQQKMLYNIFYDPWDMDRHSMAKTIKHLLISFAKDFGKELSYECEKSQVSDDF